MSLRERLITATLGGVALTAGLVVAASNLWHDSRFLVAYQAGATLLAGGLASLWVYRTVVVPAESSLAEFVSRWRLRMGDSVMLPAEKPDPDLAPLDSTVYDLVGALEERAVAMQRQHRLIHEVIRASHIGIALIGEDGRFTEVNDALRGMFRLRGEPVGKRPLEAVPSVDIHHVVEDALHQGTAERAFSTESSDLWARADRLSAGVVLRVEDVTGRREAERARTDFVANVSHELRTPLTAILGYLETALADEDRIPDDIVELLHVVVRNTKRLRDLFEDLLRLHRIEARRRDLPMQDVQLKQVLEEATSSVADRCHMRGQVFQLDCDDDLRATVNPDALSAIVSNLAVNASAYTPDGGHIAVRARDTDLGIRIDVEDDGVGIPRAFHDRIFERFYRVDSARSRQEGGTGLGLAIVKHYALACGLHISLESEVGRGSTFHVLLPPR